MIKISIRKAKESELKVINDIIRACVFAWNLSDRVKRLTVSSYQYNSFDLEHFEIFVAIDASKRIVGVAALEEVNSLHLPKGQTGLLLHGLYVDTTFQNQGIGQQLLQFSYKRVKSEKLDGLLVKAQVDANSFFKQQGFTHLPVINADKDYPYRWWKKITLKL